MFSREEKNQTPREIMMKLVYGEDVTRNEFYLLESTITGISKGMESAGSYILQEEDQIALQSLLDSQFKTLMNEPA